MVHVSFCTNILYIVSNIRAFTGLKQLKFILFWVINSKTYAPDYICISWFVVWATAEKEGVQWDLMQSSSRDQDRITQKLHHGPALNGVFIQQPLTQLTAQVPAWLTDRVVIRWDLHALLFSHLSCPNTQTLSSGQLHVHIHMKSIL